MKIKAVGAYSAKQPLEPMDITRREPGPNDVKIEIAYCGVCHSDLHQVRSEWAGTVYPCVTGHEIVGRVVAVGDQVEKHAPGDLVGVGCIVDSCKHCEECEDGLENYCDHMTGTYNSPTPDEPGHTLGGYSQQIVVHERYVLRIRHPQEQLAAVAPLLCAGITTYSPLRHWQAGPGKKVGVVGIGGLGHMGIKLAHAMGAHVVAFTTSEAKREAAKALGADEVVNSRNADEMAAQDEVQVWQQAQPASRLAVFQKRIHVLAGALAFHPLGQGQGNVVQGAALGRGGGRNGDLGCGGFCRCILWGTAQQQGAAKG